MIEDTELLRQYVADRSDAAFAELVRRRIGFVFSVALQRCGGDRHRAEEVTQQVFCDLARKARTLVDRPVLVGWFYRSTQLAARHRWRADLRRRRREEEAQLMPDALSPSDPSPEWEKLRPALDQVLDQLDDRDRDAVLLRFFDNRPYADIAEKLRLTENAARMRVDRALDKLQALLARRGITSTSAALALVLAQPSSAVLPSGFAAAVSSAALAGAGAATASTAALAFMTSAKLQLGLTATLVAAGSTGYLWHSHHQTTRHAELATLRSAQPAAEALQEERRQLEQAADEARALQQVEIDYATLREKVEAVRAQHTRADQAVAQARALWTRPPAGPTYSVAELDQPPAPRVQRPPQYPAELRRAGIEGEAVLSFIVDGDGAVQELQTVTSTHPEIALAATEAVLQWEFTPGQRQGLPVNTRLQIPIVFRIDRSKDAGPGLNNWF